MEIAIEIIADANLMENEKKADDQEEEDPDDQVSSPSITAGFRKVLNKPDISIT